MRVARFFMIASVAMLVSLLFALTMVSATFYAQGARGVCPTEDSPSCVWIGPAQGNGHGGIVVNGPERP